MFSCYHILSWPSSAKTSSPIVNTSNSQWACNSSSWMPFTCHWQAATEMIYFHCYVSYVQKPFAKNTMFLLRFLSFSDIHLKKAVFFSEILEFLEIWNHWEYPSPMGLKSLKSLKSLKKHSYFAMDISDGLKSQKKHRFLHIPPCEFSLQPEALLQSCENKTQSFSVCFETSTVPIQENMYFSGDLCRNPRVPT